MSEERHLASLGTAAVRGGRRLAMRKPSRSTTAATYAAARAGLSPTVRCGGTRLLVAPIAGLRANRRSRNPLTAVIPLACLAITSSCSGSPSADPQPLTQAVTGSIDPADPVLVGTPAGDLVVDASGDATYSIPLILPAGRNGMQPHLALTYSSSAGNGLLGVGWGLSGLSEIARCAKSFYRDGVNLTPQINDTDVYCLDGRRLIPLVPGGTEYRTEPDTFVKVIVGPAELIAGPKQWTVYQPDGTVAYYGEQPDARLELCYAANACSWRTSWAVSRVVDTSGNVMWFSYARDSFDDWSERRPDRIDWVSQADQSGNRSVQFSYLSARSDVLYTRTAGTASVETHLLKSITISAPSLAGGLPARLRSYELIYEVGSTNRNLLRSVSLCDNQSAASGHCLAPTIFTYADVAPTLIERMHGSLGLSGFDHASAQPQHLQFADVNGDGKDDLVALVAGQWQVRLSTGSDFGPALPQPGLPGGIGRLFDIDGDGRADMFVQQGPGSDQSRFYLSQATDDPMAWTSFGPAASNYAAPAPGSISGVNTAVFDFNGDGFPEYHAGPTTAYPGSPTAPTWRPTAYFGDGDLDPISHSDYRPGASSTRFDLSHVSFVDMDGDGQLDRLVPFDDVPIDGDRLYDILFARPKTLPLSKRVWQTNVPYSRCNVIADIDGDRLPEIINLKTGTVYYNTGTAAFQAVANAAPKDVYPDCDTATTDRGLRVVDYDGDGKQDVLLPQSGQILVANGTQDRTTEGLKFTTLSLGWTAPSPGAAQGTFTRTMDLDGDGLFDVFAIDSSNTIYLFQQQASTAPDLLVKVFNGPVQDEIAYQPLTSSVYVRGTGCTFPVSCYIGPRWVVSEERRDTGAGSSANPVAVRRHSYADARVDVQQGWLGFGSHTIQQLDGAGDAISTTIARIDWSQLAASTYHYRHYPFAGATTDVVTFGTADSTTKTVATHYFYKEYVPTDTAKPWFAYLNATESREYEGTYADGSAPPATAYVATTIQTHVPGAVTSSGFTSATGTDTQASYRGRNANMAWDPASGTVKSPASPLAKTTTTTTISNTPSTWILGLPTHVSAVSAIPSLPSATVTRSRTLTYDAAGRLIQTEIDKNSVQPWTYLRTKIVRGDYGNPRDIIVTADPTNDTASDARKTTIDYADGIYPSSWSTTDTLGSGKKISSSTVFHVGFGLALAQTDANGRQTGLTYDSFGRLLRVDRPDATFDTITRLVAPTDPGDGAVFPFAIETASSDGSYVIAYLDRAGRMVRTATPVGDTDKAQGTLTYIEAAYDAIGRPTYTTRPHAASDPAIISRYANYDGMGRLKTTYANCTFDDYANAPGNCQQYQNNFGFDPTSGLSFVDRIDPANITTRTEHDAARSLVRTIVDPSGKAVTRRYDYGAFGLVAGVADGNASELLIDHDSEGNIIRTSDLDTGPTNYSFNGFGDVIQMRDASGQKTDFIYDSLGRMTKRSAPDGVDTWSWDTAANGVGRIATEMRDNGASSSRSFSYRSDERLSRISQIQNGTTYDYDFSYDPQGRVSKLQYPGSTTPRFSVGYRYGLNGSLIEVQDATTTTATSLWTRGPVDTEGRITAEQLGSAEKKRTTSFDPTTGRIIAVSVPGIQDESYGYTRNGSLHSRTDNLNSPTGMPASRTETFSYDTAGRLVTASVVGRTPQDFNYDYDALGNMTKAEDTGCTNLVYGADGFGPHQLAQYTCNGTTFGSSYDMNGNEIWADRPDPRSTTWTSFHKVREVANRYGHLRYTYDANHDRVKKEVLSDAINGLSPVLPRQNDSLSGVWDTTIYVGNAYERRTLSGSNQVDQVFTIFADGRPIAERVAHSNGTAELLYVHTDFQGSITRTSTASGALKEVISTDIWGARRSGNWADTSYRSSNGGVTWPQTTRAAFTGHEHDDELWGADGGIVNMGGRTYDSFFKRFTSPDILLGENRYAYVSGNPGRYVDPTGYEEQVDEPETTPDPRGGGGNPPSPGPLPGAGAISTIAPPTDGYGDPDYGRPGAKGFRMPPGTRGVIAPAPRTRVPATPVSQFDPGQDRWPASGPSTRDPAGSISGVPLDRYIDLLAANAPSCFGASCRYRFAVTAMLHPTVADPEWFSHFAMSSHLMVRAGFAPLRLAEDLVRLGPSAFEDPSNIFDALLLAGTLRMLGDTDKLPATAARVAELRAAIPANSRGRVTMAVGLAEDGNGVQRVLIGTNEPGAYLRPGVTLRPGEILVAGVLHAEMDIIEFTKRVAWRLLEIGATRPICKSCAEVLRAAGVQTVTELKGF